MKKKLFLLSILIGYLQANTQAQTAQFFINGQQYTITHTNKDTIVSGEHRLNFVQIGFSLPSIIKKGRYDNVSILFYGTTIGTYKIGCCNTKNYNQPYENEVRANYWNNEKYQENLSSSGGYAETSIGSINITAIKNNLITGNFNATINGTSIKGNFENVEVSNLTSW